MRLSFLSLFTVHHKLLLGDEAHFRLWQNEKKKKKIQTCINIGSSKDWRGQKEENPRENKNPAVQTCPHNNN